jgi:hypothetical protein
MSELDGMTLEEARSWLAARLRVGAKCPCCGLMAKIYKRKINSGQAWGLIVFHQHVGGLPTWAHAPSVPGLATIGGDWAKLEHWGLIEESTEPRGDGGRAGWWRLTPIGLAFVLDQLRVPRFTYLFDGRPVPIVEPDSDKTVSIREALGSRFNYAELMGA